MTVGAENDQCCFGGQPGTAYAVSPDGHRLAYALAPLGTEVFIAAIGYGNVPVQQVGTRIWTAKDRVDTMAWSGNNLAAVHGSLVTVVAVPTGRVLSEVNMKAAVRTVDLQPRR